VAYAIEYRKEISDGLELEAALTEVSSRNYLST